MYRAVGDVEGGFCDACFTGDYPVDAFKDTGYPQLALFK